MYECMHVCMYACKHLYMCTCKYKNAELCRDIHIYLYVKMYSYPCICVYTCICTHLTVSIRKRKRPKAHSQAPRSAAYGRGPGYIVTKTGLGHGWDDAGSGDGRRTDFLEASGGTSYSM